MIDKIRLNAEGKLPSDYQPNLGKGFDERCVKFLNVSYPELVARIAQGGTDEDILEWCFIHGRKPSADDIEVWNAYMSIRGWNDDASARLRERLQATGFGDRSDIHTFFDFIEADEAE